MVPDAKAEPWLTADQLTVKGCQMVIAGDCACRRDRQCPGWQSRAHGQPVGQSFVYEISQRGCREAAEISHTRSNQDMIGS
jgi:hypothetical protein